MVDGIKTVPTQETKREHEKARLAWQGLIPDPEKAYQEAVARPFKATTDKGVPHKEWEDWQQRKRKDGSRPEGTVRRLVWRDPATGRFSKPFDAKAFARKHNLPTE